MNRPPLTIPFIQQILDLDSNDKIKISKEKKVTTLWAGYGEVKSITVTVSNPGNKRTTLNTSIPLIIKRVNPPSNSTSVGNQRKIKSYHVEAYFYKEIAPIILKMDQDGITSCPIAIPYSIDKKEDDKTDPPSFTFVLSDLSAKYNEYSSYPGLNLQQTKHAIAWLAAFHATFYNHDSISMQSDTTEIWTEGGYWHLKTRLDELAEIPSSQIMFQNVAYAIDERMNRNPESLTVVHGDFKEANILFSSDECAVVDFKYCGRGFGVKDLVMLIVSSVSSRILGELGEDGLLLLYADELKKNLVAIGKLNPDDIDQKSSFEILKMQYELALVDYMRFMAGWGTWGTNCGYAEKRSVEILRNVVTSWSKNYGDCMSLVDVNEEGWKEAINEKYPLSLF
jgi:hypothetical protein